MTVIRIIICIFFVLPVFLSSETITALPHLTKVEHIIVGDNLICINKGATVFLYDLNNFKLIKKMGKEGEGPGEFKSFFPTGLRITLLKEKIMIESKGKLSFYSLKGDLIKEKRLLPSYRRLKLSGDRYFASSGTLQNKVYHNVAKILDTGFNEIKTFYRDEAGYHQEKQGTNYASTWKFDVGEDKCFIVGSSDFKIDVFDKNGNSLYTISPAYNRVKVSQAFIDAWFQRITRRLGKAAYYRIKKKVRFPEFFPAILNLIVDNGHLYVLTYRREKGKSELFIFDLEGKLLKKAFLPLKNYDGVIFYPYCIKNNYLYQVIDNEDTEEWELHRFPLQF